MSVTALSLLSLFKDRISKTIDVTKEELSNFFDDGLHDYLEIQRRYHQEVRTFIFKDKSIEFEKVYFPVNFNYDGRILNDSEVIRLTNKEKSLAIIGTAGSGKTMFVSKLFLEYLKTQSKIPIVVKLRSFNSFTGTFIDFIYKKILNNKIHPSERILERVLSSGDFVFFLDGYDEIYSNNKQKLTNEIDDFIEIYNNNNFIITSRPGTSIEYSNKFRNIDVKPLDLMQVEKFISQQVNLMADILLGEKIIDTVNKPENSDYKKFLSNPLLLSMFISVYKKYPEIPKKKSKFYYHVWKTLCFDHDSINKKEGYIQDRTSGLKTDEIEDIIKWFSFIALIEGQFSFEQDYLTKTLKKIKKEHKFDFETEKLIYDLRTSLSILVLDGIEYHFPHKSIQEYFAADLISTFSDSIKKDIYQISFPNLIKLSEKGGLLNFFRLCQEVDKINFYNEFLVHFLQNFIAELNGLNIIQQFKKIAAIFPLAFGGVFVSKTGICKIDDFAYLGHHDSLLREICDYLSLDKHIFLELNKTHSRLGVLVEGQNNYFDKNYDFIRSLNTWSLTKSEQAIIFRYRNTRVKRILVLITPSFDKEVEDLFYRSGIIDSYLSIIPEMINEIKKMENDIQKESKIIKNLIQGIT